MAAPNPTRLRSGREVWPPPEELVGELDEPDTEGVKDKMISEDHETPKTPEVREFLLAPRTQLQTPSMTGRRTHTPGENLDLGEGVSPCRNEDDGEIRKADRAQRLDQEREKRPYHHNGDDPDPPKPGTSMKKEFGEQIKAMRDYSTALYSAYKRTESMRGEILWQDFISAFRPPTLRTWTDPMVVEWKALLLERGIYLDPNRERKRIEAIIDILYRKCHISLEEKGEEEIHIVKEVVEEKGKGRTGMAQEDAGRTNSRREDKNTSPSTPSTVREDNREMKALMDPEDPSEGDSSSSDDEEGKGSKGGKKRREDKEKSEERGDRRGEGITGGSGRTDSTDTYDLRSNMTGMIKSFSDTSKYGGSFEEDLDETIEAFETIAELCDITSDAQKKKAIPIMLKGSAFRLYSRNKGQIKDYEDGIATLKGWYDSKEKQTRLLKEWNQMKLSESLAQEPTKSELEIFKMFVDRSRAIQQQLHSSYHGDRQLRDRLMNGVNLPTVQDALTDRQPRTSHQLIERVANKLSHKPGTAGASVALLTSLEKENETRKEKDQAFYSLGQTYGGDARRRINHYGPKPQSGGYNQNNNISNDVNSHPDEPNFRHGNNNPRRGNANFRQGNSNFRQRRSTPWWMKGVRGCFVCRKHDHNANERHSREEVSLAIKKLKLKHPTALLTEEDQAYITELFSQDITKEEDSSEAEANWVDEEDDDHDDQGEVAYITSTDLEDMHDKLTAASFIHTTEVSANLGETKGPQFSNNTIGEPFKGVRIDTCANRTSVIGMPQYEAYCKEYNVKKAIRSIVKRSVSGIGGSEAGIGVASVDIPFKRLRLIINVKFLILKPNIPALLCMKDMIDNGLDLSIQNATISFGKLTQKLQLSNYFLTHTWDPNELSYIMYTEDELRTIHKTFGHPSVGATARLIRRAQTGILNTETRTAIEKIGEDCSICKREKGPPRRFKLTVGSDDLRFNYMVQVDTMFLKGRPVCHMVDQGTHFTAAQFLKSQTAKDIWRAIQNMWVMVYLGPPDFLTVDQGSAYISQEMRSNCNTQGIQLREAPIETPGTIGTVERYHAPLRAAYEKIRIDLDKQTPDTECLRMATYAVNCTVGPEGLCPTLLVFGAMPRPIRQRPSPQQIERAETMKAAMKIAAREQASRRIAFGLRHTRGPKAVESSAELRKLPAGSPVLVYRTKSKSWEGPHTFVSISGETAIVQTKTGRKIHRSVCVRPWIKSNFSATKVDEDNEKDNTDEEHDRKKRDEGDIEEGEIFAVKLQPDKRQGGPLTAGVQRKNTPGFEKARHEELQGLVRNGTFVPTKLGDVREGTRIFGSRFVDELKRAEEGRLRRKSRLVAQNYSDHDAATTPTKAPTIQRFSQRVLLSLAASMDDMTLFSRDITQAYVQSESALERPVFIRPPLEMRLPKDTVLRVVRPLYGIPESGLHWYLTYLNHHKERLGMTRSKMDPCFLIRHDKHQRMDGLVILQVDDSLAIGTRTFLNDEDEAATTFKSKPRHLLNDTPTTFNGIRITKNQGNIFVDQTDKIRKLEQVTNPKQFASQRAAAQYIGVNSRPDICANVQLIAPGRDPAIDPDYKSFNKIVQHLRSSEEEGLRFVRLDMTTVRLTVISDASFANAHGLRSQLGYLIIMRDEKSKANIVHYGSSRCKRVTRSVLASEVHALILAFDYAFIIQDLLHQVLRRAVEIEAFVDSKSVFDLIAKDGRTTERRLQIDIHALKESYERGELANIGWIPGSSNPADALTKETVKKTSPLRTLMATNSICLTPTGWASCSIEQKIAPVSNFVRQEQLDRKDDGRKTGEREDVEGKGKKKKRRDRTKMMGNDGDDDDEVMMSSRDGHTRNNDDDGEDGDGGVDDDDDDEVMIASRNGHTRNDDDDDEGKIASRDGNTRDGDDRHNEDDDDGGVMMA